MSEMNPTKPGQSKPSNKKVAVEEGLNASDPSQSWAAAMSKSQADEEDESI